MEVVQQSLEQAGIVYLFLGKELGARSDNPQCYVDGKVRYELLSQEASFQEGIARVLRELERYSIALMCAEGDPLKCHRTILVGRELRKRDVGLHHILPDGSLESHRDTEKRLLRLLRLPESELFRTHEEIIADAYAIQGQRIAYVNKGIGRSISEVHT